jgi:hypothetical protein
VETDPRLIASARELLEVCQALMAERDLDGSWPCQNCGREGPLQPRRPIERTIKATGEVLRFECFLCRDDLGDRARTVIAIATGQEPRSC